MSTTTEYLDRQADRLSRDGFDLEAQQIRQIAQQQRDLEQRVHALEAENSHLARQIDSAASALRRAA